MQVKRALQLNKGGLWGDEAKETADDVAVVRVADFQYEGLTASEAPTRRAVPRHLLEPRLLKPGDLLLEKSGGGEQQNVGRVVEWTGTERAICSNFINLLRPAPGFDPRWLVYVHRWLYVSGRPHACTKQTTGIQNLDLSAYLASVIPSIPYQTQRRVADFLDGECDRLGKVTRRCEALQSKLDEALFSLVSERLASQGAPTATLRRVIRSISDGPFGSSLASRHYSDQPGVRVVRLGNIGRSEFLDLDRVYVCEDYFTRELSSHALHAGEVVVAGLGDETHPLGRACVVPCDLGPALNKADCYRLTLDRSRIDAQFLAWVLSYGPAVEVAPVMARGSTRARLTTEAARNLPLPLPALSDQRDLTRSFESERRSARRMVGRLGEMTWRLTEYRDALITEAVTGQLDINRVSESQLDEKAHAGVEGQPVA